MKDADKTKEQLIQELVAARQQIAEMGASEAERVRAEEALRQSRQLLERTFASLQDAVFIIDADTTEIMDCNPAASGIFGYSRQEMLGRTTAFLHIDKAALKEFRKRLYPAVAEKGFLFLPEFKMKRKDGMVFPTEHSVMPLEDEQGKPIGWVSVVRDITERVQAGEALRESEARYKELAESIADVFFAMDKNLRYTYWNRASEELTGISAQDAIGKSLYDLFPDTPDTKRAERVYLEVLRTQRPQSFINAYRLGNKDFFFEISVYPSTAGISVFCRDITERKQAEQVQAAIYRISEAAQAAQNVDELFGLIHGIIGELMPAKNFCIVLYDASADLVHFPYFADEFDTPPPPHKSGRGLTDYVLRTGTPLLATPEVFEQLEQSGQVESVGTPSVDWLGVPLKSQQGETIGAMVVQTYTEAVRLGEADKDILMFVSTQVAMAIERKRAEEEIRRRNRELVLLNQIIAASATSAEPEAVLETACRELAQAFDVPLVAAALLNEGKTEAAIIAEYRAKSRPSVLHQAIPVADNPSFQYLLSRKAPLIVDDTQTDPRLAPLQELIRRRGTVSLLLLPLIIEGEVVGSLGLNAIEPRHFSPDEVNLAWSVADQVAGALARARLARTHQRLITAIEQAAESVVVHDTEGTILYVNPAFERVSGYSRAEAVGQHLRTVKPGTQDAAFYQKMRVALSAGQSWQGRLVSKKKDGTLYTEDGTISPVRDESGAIVSFVAVMRDVTRELQLEEQYRQAQKMEAVGRLTAGIAHDFNNLLTAINGFAELMQFQLSPDDPLQEPLGKILHSGRRAADLVRQLLAFSRKQIMEPQVLDLNAVVSDMDKMLRRIIGEDIELKPALAPDLWPVRVDPAQIEQVIVNLAVNARDAMPGGGRLTVETANVVLDEEYVADHVGTQPGQYVLLAISDTGVGMSEKVKGHVFEPFFTTKEVGKGTGLGLATVYGIVEQSGGNIWVYSEEGRGTTFKIYLPRVEEAVAPLTRRGRAGDLPRGMETVLLVEDDPAVCELVARVLRQQGYTVLETADGQEALRLAWQHGEKIHLLLADVVMPGLSGMALARQLAPLQPSMKLLFMSGYADNAVVQHSILDASVAFLQKPFNSLALARKVRQVLDAS